MQLQDNSINLIKKDLHQAFRIEELVMQDESAKHRGHALNDQVPGKEAITHLRLRLVSNDFQGLSRLQRHQRVYQALQTYFPAGLHALSMRLLTTEEASREST
jgi:stress-induced morphogen